MLIAYNWWAMALRGLLGMIVGIVMLLYPQIALQTLIILFGAYAVCNGIFNLAGAWQRAHSDRPWGVLVVEGIISVVAGLTALIWPAMAAFTLATLIAIWAMMTGILEIVAAIRLRKHITGEWLLALLGVASLLFGIVVLAAPLLGALVIAAWFGAYAFLFGLLSTVLGL